eukprot:6232832-Alexandrium_andersonii.AAC.1
MCAVRGLAIAGVEADVRSPERSAMEPRRVADSSGELWRAPRSSTGPRSAFHRSEHVAGHLGV